MNDPVALGMLASLGISKASEAALKGAVGEAAKDAYKASLPARSHRWSK